MGQVLTDPPGRSIMKFDAFAAFNTGETPSGGQVSPGVYPTYTQAQRVVDHLADNRFEVETTQIVGSDLRLVEQVTGRQTWFTVIAWGVATGVWFGLLIGLVLSIVDSTSVLGSILWGVSWGAVFWTAFAVFDYALSRGRRDFTSLTVTVPSTFEVLVDAEAADRARSILAGSA
jgi:hypothetical protein